MLKKSELNLIRNAVVSLYIHLARLEKITASDQTLLDSLLQSIFGEFEEHNIIEYTRTLYSFQQATKIIKRYLKFFDKLLLLINLLSITYAHKKNFKILSSLEIIKLVDHLYIDVNIYDQILDVLEKKADHFFLPERKLSGKTNNLFHNILIIGNEESDDIFFRNKNAKIFFFVFEKLIFVGFQNFPNIQLDNKKLEKDKVYVIEEDQELIIPNHSQPLILNNQIIIQLFRSVLSQKKVSHYISEKFSFDIIQNGAKITLQKNFGELKINGQFSRKQQEIALNDEIEFEEKINGLEILLGKMTSSLSTQKNFKYFIEFNTNFFKINQNKTNNAIAILENNEGRYFITPLKEDLYLNKTNLNEKTEFDVKKATFSFHDKNFRLNQTFDIQKVDLQIEKLTVENLSHKFEDGSVALDHISFEIKQNEFMVILGPSGSGKTTLLKTLMHYLIPQEANIKINDHDLFENFAFFRKYIGYVSQDDLLFPNLTVYENLYYSTKLRLNHIKDEKEINKRITNILRQVGLFEKKDQKVGSVLKKTLSGGQRKRLNIALELIAEPLILFLDEPTSGLSSKDSEKLINLLNELKEEDKIIIATVHQPNTYLFQKFDKILLLDQGGIQVYFGDTDENFSYFDNEISTIIFDRKELLHKKAVKMPEYFFDILEYPNIEQAKNIAYKNNENAFSNRKFPPAYWKKKYNKNVLFELIDKSEKKEIGHKQKNERKLKRSRLSPIERFSQFYYLFIRNLKNKFTNKINLLITFVASPLLALIISFILRFSENNVYSFHQNENILMFIFISIIVFIFLGLANSLDEILAEKRIILREKKLDIKSSFFLFSKLVALLLFTLIQTILYLLISKFVLDLPGIPIFYLIFLFLSGIIGFSIGVLASAFIQDRKAIINILPLVLIPQILFAGAVISFDKMNSALKINKKASVPEFCEIIASKWLFEGMMIAQANYNKYDRKLDRFILEKKKIVEQKIRLEIEAEMNAFLQKENPQKYRNAVIEKVVNNQDGNYYLNKRNYFLTSHKFLLGSEIDTLQLNIIIVIIFILLINLISWIKLEFFYEES